MGLPFSNSGGSNSGNGIFEPAPKQKTGGADHDVRPESIPSGGKLPKADPGSGNNSDVGVGSPSGGRKPFKGI